MSKSTISTFELFQMFPDAEAARVYMEGKRWPDGAVCPACDEGGDWHINGCCGGGCYVVSNMKFCPYCGTKVAKHAEVTMV